MTEWEDQSVNEMALDRTGNRTVRILQYRFGMPVETLEGPILPKSVATVTAHTEGFKIPSELSIQKLLGGKDLTKDDFDPAFQKHGALIFKGAAGGLAAVRLRLRPESGEEGARRSFHLANVAFVPDVSSWSDVPVGFFSWAQGYLEAVPHVVGDQNELAPRTIDLPYTPEIDPDRIGIGPHWRCAMLCEMFAYIYDSAPQVVVGPDEITHDPAEVLGARELDRFVKMVVDDERRRDQEPHTAANMQRAGPLPACQPSEIFITLGLKAETFGRGATFLSSVEHLRPDLTNLDRLVSKVRASQREFAMQAPIKKPSVSLADEAPKDNHGRVIGMQSIYTTPLRIDGLGYVRRA